MRGMTWQSRQRGGAPLAMVSPGSVMSAAVRSAGGAGAGLWCAGPVMAVIGHEPGARKAGRRPGPLEGAAAGQRLGMLVMEPGSLVMERKMLLGLKRRAERLAAERSTAQR